MKRLAILLVLILSAAFMATGYTPDHDGVCTEMDSGKIDIGNDSTYTLLIVAPEGYLIEGYCVKAGSANQGDGPVYVTVDPPAKAITISHPSGKAISHYAVGYTTNAYDYSVTGVCTVFEDNSRVVDWTLRNLAPDTLTILDQDPDSGFDSVGAGEVKFWSESIRHDSGQAGASWSVLGQWPDQPPASRGDSIRFELECPDWPTSTTTTTVIGSSTTVPPETTTSTTTPISTTTVPDNTSSTTTVPTVTTTIPVPTLPVTGFSPLPWLLIAGLALTLGTLTLLATRKSSGTP